MSKIYKIVSFFLIFVFGVYLGRRSVLVRFGLLGILYISYMVVGVFVCCILCMYISPYAVIMCHIVFNLHLFNSLLLVHLRHGLLIIILQLFVMSAFNF